MLVRGQYDLSQNYPNPFNPSTFISYSVPALVDPQKKEGIYKRVTLMIYDILGREIKTLVNENQNPGNYKVKFNGGDLASGIYFYRLQVGSFVSVKKMMLIK